MYVYKSVIRPFFEKHKYKTLSFSSNFGRVFSIVGDLNEFALGKTVHDTRKTLEFNVHVAQNYFYFNNASPPEDFKISTAYRIDSFFNHNLGHVSHFRKRQYFLYKSVSISDFYLDLNYLYCYFLPIFDELDKQ